MPSPPLMRTFGRIYDESRAMGMIRNPTIECEYDTGAECRHSIPPSLSSTSISNKRHVLAKGRISTRDDTGLALDLFSAEYKILNKQRHFQRSKSQELTLHLPSEMASPEID